MGVFWLLAYLTFVIGVGLVMATLIRSGDNPVANFWKFVDIHVLQADFATFTSRTKIWQAAFDLLKKNPRDFVFGLGLSLLILILLNIIEFLWRLVFSA